MIRSVIQAENRSSQFCLLHLYAMLGIGPTQSDMNHNIDSEDRKSALRAGILGRQPRGSRVLLPFVVSEGDDINESALKDLVRAAVAHNLSDSKKK